MIELRRVQVTGKSTLIVSLPKTWAKMHGIKPKCFVEMIITSDGSLLIRPHEKGYEKALKIEFHYHGDRTVEGLFREIVAAYLSGYNIITLRFEDNDLVIKDKIKKFVRNKLVGLEILGETSNSITMHCLVKYDDISINYIAERMSVIAEYMVIDAIRALEAGDKRLAEEVMGRDDEVDRLYLFASRQLNKAIMNLDLLRKIGLRSTRDCLEYKLALKSIERVADHAENIARLALKLGRGLKLEDYIEKAFRESLELFRLAIKALLELNMDLAHEVLDKEIEILNNGYNEDTKYLPVVRLLIESIKRIADYSKDIAEVVLNISL